MEVARSSVAGLELFRPDTREFKEAVESLLGREPDDVLKPALPYSVIVTNRGTRAVALLGIRFDMLGRQAKRYAVIHYSDTLRHPEAASLPPGAARFVCAEPLYTDLVLHQARAIDRRGPMNLGNLRKALRICASLDCAAFDNGQFGGPDTLGAFDRLETEREAEIAFLAELLGPGCAIEKILEQALEIPAGQAADRTLLTRRTLARQLYESLESGGPDAVAACARNHRLKIRLWRTGQD